MLDNKDLFSTLNTLLECGFVNTMNEHSALSCTVNMSYRLLASRTELQGCMIKYDSYIIWK